MIHEMPAAGCGFIWPQVIFASDGETIWVKCRPSPPQWREPVRYLSDFDAFVTAVNFESTTDKFIDLVLRRLDVLGETELHVLWREILAERADPIQSVARKMEVRLGCDPDEAPIPLLKRLLNLASEAGPDAADEIAPVCAGSEPVETFNEVMQLSSQPGYQDGLQYQRERVSAGRDCHRGKQRGG